MQSTSDRKSSGRSTSLSRALAMAGTLAFFHSGAGDLMAEPSAKGVLPNAVVEMRSISFAPESLTVKVGQSVQWWNVSYTQHSATANAFDTGMVNPKDTSKPVVFSKAGKYVYHCRMHGRTMSGEIVVIPMH